MATPLKQTCTHIDVNGALKFQVHSFLDSSFDINDLPFPDVFVYQIVSTTDPKQDTFARVANISDLSTLKRSRDQALAANQTKYLSTSFVISYDDVLTATKAKQLVQARVDQLISDWKMYNTQFIVPDQTILPAVDSTIVSAAKSAYASAKKDLAAKQTALATANNKLSLALAAVTSATDALTTANGDAVACQQAGTVFHAAMAGEQAFRTNVDSFINTAPNGLLDFMGKLNTFMNASLFQPTPGDGQPWQVSDANYLAMGTQISALKVMADGLVAAQKAEIVNGKGNLDAADSLLFVGANAMCPKKATATITTATAKNTADTAVSAAQTAQAQATAAVTAAQQVADTTLSAALDVCPSFDPASV